MILVESHLYILEKLFKTLIGHGGKLNIQINLRKIEFATRLRKEDACVYVCVCLYVFSHVRLLQLHGTVALQALCPWNFPGKNTGLGLPFPIPRDSLNPEIEPVSLVSSALADE